MINATIILYLIEHLCNNTKEIFYGTEKKLEPLNEEFQKSFTHENPEPKTKAPDLKNRQSNKDDKTIKSSNSK